MPDSVLQPAPVSTAARRSRKSSTTPLNISTLEHQREGDARGSALLAEAPGAYGFHDVAHERAPAGLGVGRNARRIAEHLGVAHPSVFADGNSQADESG